MHRGIHGNHSKASVAEIWVHREPKSELALSFRDSSRSCTALGVDGPSTSRHHVLAKKYISDAFSRWFVCLIGYFQAAASDPLCCLSWNLFFSLERSKRGSGSVVSIEL